VVQSTRDRLVLPFYERKWNATTDIATILGLSGASVRGDATMLFRAWREYAKAQGWVAGYVHLSIFFDPPADYLEEAGKLVSHQAAFLLDLSPVSPLAPASKGILAKIRDTERTGFELVEDRAALAPSLKKLYPESMRRAGAKPHFLVSERTLEGWALDPGSLVLGASVQGEIAAVSVFNASRNHAEYQINATTPEGRSCAAWLIWHAVRILKARGVLTMNLGGGVRPGDGLYCFKERFGGIRRPIYSLRQVYDHEEFANNCLAAGVRPAGDWFPPYRYASAH
jgi:hypothetical protein